MPESSYLTKQEFYDTIESLRHEVETITKKLDLILDPKRGFYRDLLDMGAKTKEASDGLSSMKRDIASLRQSVYGNGKVPGLVAEVRALEAFRYNIQKVIWRVLTPILGALGVGILYLVYNALSQH